MNSIAIERRARSTHWFYVWVSGVLLLIVVAGFSQTYYLRLALGTETLAPGIRELPAHLHWHGLVLSAWFVLALVQPTLIASHRARVHRLLGWVGVGLALAVVSVTFLAVARAVPDSATDIPPELLPGVIGGDLAVLLVFSMLVTGAVLWRRNREAHLRLMLLASVAMVGTAVSRLPGALALLPFSILAVQIGIPVALMINDRLRLGRVHRATIFGTAVLVAGVAAGVAVGLTGPGQRAILEWLG